MRRRAKGWRVDTCDCGAEIIWAPHVSGDLLAMDGEVNAVIAQPCRTKDGWRIRLVTGFLPHTCGHKPKEQRT